MEHLKPELVYEDTYLAVLIKPAGLLSQGDHSGEWNLVDALRAHFGRNYVGLIHRLDRNVSGLMVVAKRTKSAQRLTKAMQSGQLHRNYIAWVAGHLNAPQELRHFLRKNERTNEVEISSQPSNETKEAKLRAIPRKKIVVSGVEGTEVLVELETGRSHQIRVQLSAIGHPLFGDPKYGEPHSKKIEH